MSQTPHAEHSRWEEIKAIWSENRWLYGIAGVIIGLLSAPALEQIISGLNDLLGNLVPEAIGMIFTVAILDRLAENRSRNELRTRLLNEMRSSAIGQGTAALNWLRREGWLTDDTLEGADLHRANWEYAYVGGLNMTNANLNGAKLTAISNQITDQWGTREERPVIFNGAWLLYSHLHEAVLIGANFSGTRMKKAHLNRAVLINSNFAGSDLREADLSEAKLQGVNFAGANLREAWLDAAIWMNDSGKNPAILPDGVPWTPATDLRKYSNPLHPEYSTTLQTVNTLRLQMGYPIIEQNNNV